MKKINIFLAAAILFTPLSMLAARSYSIAIILSGSDVQYEKAAAGFEKTIKKAKLTRFLLGEGGDEAAIKNVKRSSPDLIVAIGTTALEASKSFGKIPVVYCVVFAEKGSLPGNSAGVTLTIPAGERMEQISKIIPGMSKLGIIYSDESSGEYEKISEEAGRKKIQIVAKKLDSVESFYNDLRDMEDKVDVFLMVPDSKTYMPQSVKFLLTESIMNKFPVIGLSSQYTKAGALMSFDCDYADIGAQAAEIAQKILEGASAGTFGTAPPRKVSYSINVSTASSCKLKVSPGAEAGAGQVFGN